MSLSVEERKITSTELYRHLNDATLSVESLASHFNLTTQDITAILNMENTEMDTQVPMNEFIHLVWDVRDYINDVIRTKGLTPEAYSYLKGMKTDYWFLK
ncbi:DUF2316 family protein [Macrococcoides caseolyticum]|uniref:DUF2316 family protein n=1 Tax=Macrococcoides caseolyticum TaxID=69966 RepID=UPI001F440C22|nr:DUF2316 family protein [Macrococcus caseolyticus]MCE4957776.1 DUF2316 family protein [Macrococcus caseolyticus]